MRNAMRLTLKRGGVDWASHDQHSHIFLAPDKFPKTFLTLTYLLVLILTNMMLLANST